MQMNYLLPLYARGQAQVHGPSFTARVSLRFLKSTMNRDLARTFPQMHADLAARLSPQLLHSGITAYQLSRKALITATARFVFQSLYSLFSQSRLSLQAPDLFRCRFSNGVDLAHSSPWSFVPMLSSFFPFASLVSSASMLS